jgi:hypothetical protein
VLHKIPQFHLHCYNGKSKKKVSYNLIQTNKNFVYSVNESVYSQASANAGDKLACFTLFVDKSLRAKYVG